MRKADEDNIRLYLTLPSSAAYVGTARAFIAATARHFGAEEEDVADLKVAVSEACSGAVRASDQTSEPFKLSIDAQPHELTVEILTPATPSLGDTVGPVDPDLPPRRFEEAVRATLINTLFPKATLETRDGGLAVRFAVSLIPPDIE
jgi:serine/threonine-protein kinase RsbW